MQTVACYINSLDSIGIMSIIIGIEIVTQSDIVLSVVCDRCLSLEEIDHWFVVMIRL